ncbi:MAG: hypothetical protein KDJ27_19855 [Gammaproteobacteria bacterium]|nr:hypothetical protein [Gammaproteobacteria bacterium]MCB1925957.1 hypothetical protein [Gammaproteobacteria bacterium]
MKTTLSAIIFALAAGSAVAQPFDFQRQFGSSEYVPGADAEGMVFAEVVPSSAVPTLTATMLAANVDGIAPNRFIGQIEESGPVRISLYEIQRGSPEATAYSDYYARYPADTDWERLSAEFRASRTNNGIASQANHGGDRS